MVSYIICGVLGASSFSLVPVALEWLARVTWPIGPEIGSVICWMGGQALEAISIIVSDALQDNRNGNPPGNIQKALISEAVIAMAVAPTAILLGWTKGGVRNKRLDNDIGTGESSSEFE